MVARQAPPAPPAPPAPDHTESPAPLRARGQDLARRIRGPRMVGVLLCAACILSALPQRPIALGYWFLTALFVFGWPQLAYFWATRSANPLRAEKINLWLDAAFVGCFAAAIEFALVPSAALLMATSLSNVTVGGLRFVLVGLSGHLTGAALGVLIWGAHFSPAGDTTALLGALPLLVLYPLLMGSMLYRLASRLNDNRRELRYLSEHDALSGVHNRRFFDQYLRQIFSQFLRHERSLSLLVGDVDDFKRINDRHGHAAGDEVIRQFGLALSQCARAGDVVARLGGDEFVVLLSDADAEQAFHYARRVQERLCQLMAHAQGDLPEIRVSFGVAMARRHMKSHEHWLEQADRALYRTKAGDRGGVTLAGGDDPQPAAAG